MLDAPETPAAIVFPAVVRPALRLFIDWANRPCVWESASASPIERPPASCAVPAELPAPAPPPLPPIREATPPEAANEDRTAAPEEVPGSTNSSIRNTTSGHTAPIRISMDDTSAMPTAAAFLSPLPASTPSLILTPMPSTRAASGEISEAEMNQRQDFQNQLRPMSLVSPAAEIAEVVVRIIRAAHRASWMNTYPNAAGRTTSRPVMPRTVAATVSVTSRGPVNEEATAANESTFSSALSRALVRPEQAAVIAEAPASPMVQTAPNWAVPTRSLARDRPSLFQAIAPSWSNTIKVATAAPMPNVYGRIARNGPVADRSGSLKASMIRNATASAHMAADHNATMAPFQPSAAATAAASPSHCIGLNLPRSMPNAGTAAISVRPCRVLPCSVTPCRVTRPAAVLLTAKLLVPRVDGRIRARPDGGRRGRLCAGPGHPAA